MDNDDNVIDIGRIAKMRNLKPYKGKTDDEIREIISNRNAPIATKSKRNAPKETKTGSILDEKLKILLDEYAVDMNNSNDLQALNNLAMLQVQLEVVSQDIKTIHEKEHRTTIDYDSLKKLGDLQRVTITSINDLTRDLGISRKQRKEKAVDDIPQFIAQVRQRAKVFYDKKTVKVECPRCIIELARYWLNFPNEDNDIQMSLTCWKCKEPVEYVG